MEVVPSSGLGSRHANVNASSFAATRLLLTQPDPPLSCREVCTSAPPVARLPGLCFPMDLFFTRQPGQLQVRLAGSSRPHPRLHPRPRLVLEAPVNPRAYQHEQVALSRTPCRHDTGDGPAAARPMPHSVAVLRQAPSQHPSCVTMCVFPSLSMSTARPRQASGFSMRGSYGLNGQGDY